MRSGALDRLAAASNAAIQRTSVSAARDELAPDEIAVAEENNLPTMEQLRADPDLARRLIEFYAAKGAVANARAARRAEREREAEIARVEREGMSEEERAGWAIVAAEAPHH